eukprot:TRINITY_DN3785_c0_g1_i3.p1 TRINITY_DN3785_c0_g1~~TRINITY_DN3785_c0_g1_i3.p1  ORF type:complete len:1220 (+),score=300.93 TRINITY_DN3785_c0_g1_i3:685-4344(+)
MPTYSPVKVPTYSPAKAPTGSPAKAPTTSPSKAPLAGGMPTQHPHVAPSSSPSKSPSTSPTRSPSTPPQKRPTTAPSSAPSRAPTGSPRKEPTASPTVAPTAAPMKSPTAGPSTSPSGSPAKAPTAAPSVQPTQSPSAEPTGAPSKPPVKAPTTSPSASPTGGPIKAPTDSPSVSPSASPMRQPSAAPSVAPTASPQKAPTYSPRMQPTYSPTGSPAAPSVSPSVQPSASPAVVPTASPSVQPSVSPSAAPTQSPAGPPTVAPSVSPSAQPSVGPSASPAVPSASPTAEPSRAPVAGPQPSTSPTVQPSLPPMAAIVLPTTSPSGPPSKAPSAPPTVPPTGSPVGPTVSPSASPSVAPSAPPLRPSTSPTLSPSVPPTTSPIGSPSSTPTRAPSLTPRQPAGMTVELANPDAALMRKSPQVIAVFRLSGDSRFDPQAQVSISALQSSLSATEHQWAGKYEGFAAFAAAGGNLSAEVSADGTELRLLAGGADFRLRSPHQETMIIGLVPEMFVSASAYQAVCQDRSPPCDSVPLGTLSGEPVVHASAAQVQAQEQGQAAAVAAAASTTVLAAAVGGGASAANVARLSMVQSVVDCPQPPGDPAPLPVALNPLQLSFGRGMAKYAHGTVVGNTILLGLAIAMVGVALVMEEKKYQVKRDNARARGLIEPKHSLRSMLVRARLGWLIVPMSFLYGGVGVGAVTTLWHGDLPFVPLAILNLMVYSGALLYYTANTARKAPRLSVWRPLPPEDKLSGYKWVIWGDSEWIPHPENLKTFKWLGLHHLVFDGYRAGIYRYTMAFELFYTFLMAFLSVWMPKNLKECQIQACILAALPSLWALYVLALRPYIAPYENWMDGAIAAGEGVMMAVLAAGLFQPPESWHGGVVANLGIILVWMITVKSVIDLVIFVTDEYLLWQEHMGGGDCSGFARWFCCFQGKVQQLCGTQCFVCRDALGKEDVYEDSDDDLKGDDPSSRRFLVSDPEGPGRKASGSVELLEESALLPQFPQIGSRRLSDGDDPLDEFLVSLNPREDSTPVSEPGLGSKRRTYAGADAPSRSGSLVATQRQRRAGSMISGVRAGRGSRAPASSSMDELYPRQETGQVSEEELEEMPSAGLRRSRAGRLARDGTPPQRRRSSTPVGSNPDSPRSPPTGMASSAVLDNRMRQRRGQDTPSGGRGARVVRPLRARTVAPNPRAQPAAGGDSPSSKSGSLKEDAPWVAHGVM